MNRIICSRFDSKIPNIFDTNESQIPLTFKRKKECKEFYCIATNGQKIYDGKEQTLNSFFKKHINIEKTLLVLTDKEVFYLKRWCYAFDIRVVSLESAFPFFDKIKFKSDYFSNYSNLKSRLNYAKKIGFTSGTFTSTLSSRIEKIIKRKIKHKTSYDEVFAHSYFPPYQEVFKFCDFREKRSIISLDFNSMFADCMAGEFLDPESIFFEDINATLPSDSDSTKVGLYHVILKHPKSIFFQEYHPFNLTQLGLSLKFKAENGSEIETQLFNFELDYYKRFFEEVYVLSALKANNVTGHPLYNECKRLYRLRTRARKQNKPSLAKSYKLQLAMLHSATNKKAEKELTFKSTSDLLSLLNEELHLTLDNEIPLLINSSPLLKKIRVSNNDEGKAFMQWNFKNSNSIYSFSSQVVSKSRLKMFQTLEALNNFDGLNICYVNTDSVHVSIPDNTKQDFFKTYNHLIGSDIGELKVQCIADKAVWFDVGHYFMFKNNEVIQYSNVGLNHKGNHKPFLDYREKYNCVRLNDGVALSKCKTTFMSSLSYKKRLQQLEHGDQSFINYQRFSVEEIIGFDNATLNILKEKRASYSTKKELFSLIRTKYNSLQL